MKTINELSKEWNCDFTTVMRAVNRLKLHPIKSENTHKGKSGRRVKLFSDEQAELIKKEIPSLSGRFKENAKIEESMTTKEVAEQLNTSSKVILENAKKCLPNKIIENGKSTFWTKKEITILLEQLKKSQNNQHTFTGAVKVVQTDLTPALKLKQALDLAQEAYEEELAILRAKNEQIQAENETLKIELDKSKEFCSIKRMSALNPKMDYSWKALRAYSMKNEIEIKKVFDQNYGKVNAYHRIVWEAVYGEQCDKTPWD